MYGPNQHLEPYRRGAESLEGEHRANDDMAHDQDHEIGRQIIGAMKVEPLSALLAAWGRP